MRPFQGQVHNIATPGCSRVMKNLVYEHKILEMSFRIKSLHATSRRVLCISIYCDISMRERLLDGRSYFYFIILEVMR